MRSFCVGVFEPKFSQKTLENCLQIWGELVKESATPNLPFNTKIAYLRILRGSDY